MKKLTLKLDDLSVESFDTLDVEEQEGTVEGNSGFQCDTFRRGQSCNGATDCGTCAPNWTCDGSDGCLGDSRDLQIC